MYMDGLPAYLIKSVTRPNLNIDPVTIDHINIKKNSVEVKQSGSTSQ